MTGKNISVFALYRDRLEAEEAILGLRAAGFRDTDVSVMFQENAGTKDLGHQKSTKAPEGATIGFILGAVVGGVLGWLVGIGTLTIPGFERLAAAGPVVAALAGVGALGALAGIIGALVGSTSPEYEAKRYKGRIKGAGVLLSVHCDGEFWVRRAKEALQHSGAEGIGAAAESGADFLVTDRPKQRVPQTASSLPPRSELPLSREDVPHQDAPRPIPEPSQRA